MFNGSLCLPLGGSTQMCKVEHVTSPIASGNEMLVFTVLGRQIAGRGTDHSLHCSSNGYILINTCRLQFPNEDDSMAAVLALLPCLYPCGPTGALNANPRALYKAVDKAGCSKTLDRYCR